MTLARLNSRTGIPLHYANRHGLITGATGTGKTVTLQRLAEQFSKSGVPVFIADVKGDIAALSRSCPVSMLDLFGKEGAKVNLTFAAMGADLIARALELSDVQAAAVEIAFAYARDTSARLDTIADFRCLLATMSHNREAIGRHYGQVTQASLGVVLRSLLRLESQGGSQFFRAPAFNVAELISAPDKVSILAAETLIQSPRLYGAFLLYLLSDLYNRLPEVGDLDKPRLVFFFDEAHLLFSDCPAALLRKIEQTVRLIRSKGVGVYFVSQSVDDVPQLIRDQLAHRVEHDRALPVGTARVLTMDATGRPLNAGLVKIDLPDCPLGALSESERPRFHADQRPVAPLVPRWHVAAFLAAFWTALAMLAYYAWHYVGTVRPDYALAATVGVVLAFYWRGKPKRRRA